MASVKGLIGGGVAINGLLSVLVFLVAMAQSSCSLGQGSGRGPKPQTL